jgi:hypothetical protein
MSIILLGIISVVVAVVIVLAVSHFSGNDKSDE